MPGHTNVRRTIDHVERARAFYLSGQHERALRHVERALEDEANCSEQVYGWAAVACAALSQPERGRAFLERGLSRFPQSPDLLLEMGCALSRAGRQIEARAVLEDCVKLAPGMAAAWISYSAVLHIHCDYVASRDAARKALELEPARVEALMNYANAMKELGDVPEAVRTFRRASEIDPAEGLHRCSLLFTMLFDEATTPADLRREAEAYASLLTRRGRRKRRGKAPEGGKIRLGMLSNDLLSHACAYSIIPFLTNLNRDLVEVHLFSLNSARDHVTTKFELHSDAFMDLSGKSDAAIMDAIDDAGLDILIDLGGFTGKTPVAYMIHGLAPVQVAWLGYPGTTGTKAMHYRISDWVADPAGNEGNYVESLLRSPTSAVVYYPLVTAPLNAYEAKYAVRQTPALANGSVTFGCCINLAKISAHTLRLWSAVLANCPGSKLLVECSGLEKDEVCVALLARMESAGIASDRVICVPRGRQNQYVLYHRIDVVLDTTPITGGTNTCDALWMGVPVVSLAGGAFHERISATCLHAVGLDQLVCSSDEEYVRKAVALASDLEGLNALRLTLRSRVEQGGLGDAQAFCRWFESEAVTLVSQYRDVPEVPARAGDGIFLSGQWYAMEQLILLVMSHLERREFELLGNLLENISAKWCKHWLVAYALAEMAHANGERERALDLLIESAALRKYSLPLYRLLSARLDECGRDKSLLEAFLRESFGIELSYLDRQGVPSRLEIAGIQADTQREAA